MNLVCSIVRELESEKYLPFWSVILNCSFNLTFLIYPRQIVLKCSFNLTFLIDLRQIFLECSLNLTFLIDLSQIGYVLNRDKNKLVIFSESKGPQNSKIFIKKCCSNNELCDETKNTFVYVTFTDLKIWAILKG